MITLKYGIKNAAVVELESKIQQLSLAYQIEEKKSNKQIILQDGKLEIKGVTAILKHLEELQGELSQWYYCAC